MQLVNYLDVILRKLSQAKLNINNFSCPNFMLYGFRLQLFKTVVEEGVLNI